MQKKYFFNSLLLLILILNKPMAEMIQIIDSNKKQVQTVQAAIDGITEDINELEKSLKLKEFDIELEDLDHPATVCAHTMCKSFAKVGQTQVTNTVYDQLCHDHCTIKGIPTETINDPRIAHCSAFDFDTTEAKSKLSIYCC